MLLDPATQTNAIPIIEKLVKADPSYKNTPSYGLVVAMQEDKDEDFLFWSKYSPASAKELTERIYVRDPKDEQDMPVSQEVYDKITQIMNQLYPSGIIARGYLEDEF